MAEPKRIALLMDNRADANWGSQATTAGLVELVRARFPGAEIRGVPRRAASPGKPLRYWCEKIGPEILVRGRRDPAARLSLFLTSYKWRSIAQWADVLLVNGEGTLHPQDQTRRWLPALVDAHQSLKKPIWVANASIFFAGSWGEPMFRRFLQSAEHVAVREPESFRHLAAAGFSPVQAADCAFLASPAAAREADELLSRNGIAGDFAVLTGTSKIESWPVKVQRALVEALRAEGLQVLYAHSTRVDERNLHALGLSLPAITQRDATYQQLMAVQAKAQILVGGRFHPTIFAALTGTPFVSVESNSHKTAGLMEMLGTEDLLVGSGDLDGQIACMRRVFKNRSTLGAQLFNRAKELREWVGQNLPEA